MKSNRVLGKGLSALIQGVEESTGQLGQKEVKLLSLKELGYNKNHPRKVFDHGKLSELSESIKQVGILQPILVRRLRAGEVVRAVYADPVASGHEDPSESPGKQAKTSAAAAAAAGATTSSITDTTAVTGRSKKPHDIDTNARTDAHPDSAQGGSFDQADQIQVQYSIVAGERRVRAARIADIHEVPAIICTYEETEALKVALLENIQREDLGPIEEAQAYRQLQESYGATQEELATMLGKNRSSIANTIRLLSLEDELQNLLQENKITRGHAKVLLGMEPGPARVRLARLCHRQDLSVRVCENKVKAVTGKAGKKTRRPRKTPSETPEVRALRERAEHVFGSPVRIDRDARTGKGKVCIQFYSDADLERLLAIMGVDTDLS